MNMCHLALAVSVCGSVKNFGTNNPMVISQPNEWEKNKSEPTSKKAQK